MAFEEDDSGGESCGKAIERLKFLPGRWFYRGATAINAPLQSKPPQKNWNASFPEISLFRQKFPVKGGVSRHTSSNGENCHNQKTQLNDLLVAPHTYQIQSVE